MTAGPKLGKPIADHVARAVLGVKRQYAPEIVKLGMQLQEEFFRLTGGEHRATTGEIWRMIADSPDAEGWVATVARFLADGHGQWQTMLAGQATGAALGGGIMDLLTNELAPVIQPLIRGNPHGLLAPGDLATGAARGRMDYASAADNAAKGGINAGNFRVLYESSLQVPSPDQIGAMLDRGLLTPAQADAAMVANGTDPRYRTPLLGLRRQLLSPSDLAALVTFGVLTQDEATPIAEASGMHADDFAWLVLGNGQPPGVQDLLVAYRRGVIDRARLLRGITQGPVRNEWFDVIESLGAVPMSTADAIDAAVQGHLTVEQARRRAAENGLDREDFDPLLQTAGSPPGPEFVLHMMQRGLLTQAETEQALRESRLKNKYIPLYVASARALLPMEQVRTLLHHGTITHDQALHLIMQHGYSHEDAAAIVASVSAAKTATTRHLTEGQLVELYADRALSARQATDALEALGYTSGEVELILGEADLRRMRRFVEGGISAIRAAYVGHHISELEASTKLDVLLTPADRKDDLLALWDLEREVNVKALTLAQVSAAHKRNLINDDEFRRRVSAMGYRDDDVTILLGLAGAPAA